MTHYKSNSDDWKNENWKQHQKVVFRLQKRIYKAVREEDIAKAKRLQKLLLSSYSARMIAIRQVSLFCQTPKTFVISKFWSLCREKNCSFF
ncbi:hypothetical protein H1P_1070007 [Hyella patelloides LEGE 07179]|uniref:Reverse transcriptase N-terminal domain-containing protein n=1 Tax=Hyella patelloides LEGE 07179 TaxID=945734 RepID=A0A563VJL0_9CYAN|nr:reverse transcriptase N-terminal domain-containing protein [Hyella patelloides]VEP11495.1 hypothetical protein H1P_1070007 [Hyella patelloides LEGE 07179]